MSPYSKLRLVRITGNMVIFLVLCLSGMTWHDLLFWCIYVPFTVAWMVGLDNHFVRNGGKL